MKRWVKVTLWVVGSVGLLVAVFVASLWFMLSPENWQKRKGRFARAAERAEGIIAAIKAYEADHQAPPSSLHALVPKYLTVVPNTSLRDYPAYEYSVFPEAKSSLVWYDLGSRNGKPMAGLWVFLDGDPEHAILAFTLDQRERIVEARTDRMPESYEKMDFDSAKWKQNESRIEMVRSLPQQLDFKQRPFAEIKELLGDPTGARILRNSPWELRINCSNGMLNWDVFFYWPALDYPPHIYGGSIERIGDWAYVHE